MGVLWRGAAAAWVTACSGVGVCTTVQRNDGMPVIPEDLQGVELFTDEFITSDSELSEGIPNGAFGDIDLVPPEVLEHVAAPLDFSSHDSDEEGEESDALGQCSTASAHLVIGGFVVVAVTCGGCDCGERRVVVVCVGVFCNKRRGCMHAALVAPADKTLNGEELGMNARRRELVSDWFPVAGTGCLRGRGHPAHRRAVHVTVSTLVVWSLQKRLLEDPIAAPTKPLWPIYSTVLQMEQVQKVRVVVVVVGGVVVVVVVVVLVVA